MSDLITIRTTMQPHIELKVNDREYLDLKRQGLVLEDDEPQDEEKATKAGSPKTAKTADGSKEK